jgi:hypothetical protein
MKAIDGIATTLPCQSDDSPSVANSAPRIVPGMVAVTLVSGSIQWFDENCKETDENARESWTEGSKLHYFRVVGTVGVHLTAFFITAQGAALRSRESEPLV